MIYTNYCQQILKTGQWKSGLKKLMFRCLIFHIIFAIEIQSKSTIIQLKRTFF